jgi:hypothetical protein
VIAAVPAVGAVVAWVSAAVRLSGQGALAAMALAGIAAVYGAFVWWVALRPKLVLTDDDIVAVTRGALSAWRSRTSWR